MFQECFSYQGSFRGFGEHSGRLSSVSGIFKKFQDYSRSSRGVPGHFKCFLGNARDVPEVFNKVLGHSKGFRGSQ